MCCLLKLIRPNLSVDSYTSRALTGILKNKHAQTRKVSAHGLLAEDTASCIVSWLLADLRILQASVHSCLEVNSVRFHSDIGKTHISMRAITNFHKQLEDLTCRDDDRHSARWVMGQTTQTIYNDETEVSVA
jgi:hypothetical protein